MPTFHYFVALLLALVSHAAAAAPHKVVNLRNATDADGLEREISFCTRPSPGTDLPGHAFVAFSTTSQKQPRTYQAIGYTTKAPPAAAMLTYFKVVPKVEGHLDEEKYTDAKEECLVVQVNKDAYEKARATMKAPITKYFPGMDPPPPLLLGYRLGAEDCMTFMIEVARTFNGTIKVPQRGATELPLSYLRRMIEGN